MDYISHWVRRRIYQPTTLSSKRLEPEPEHNGEVRKGVRSNITLSVGSVPFYFLIF